MTSLRFLHTADWQLGMTRHFLDPEAQARFSAARLDAVRAVGQLADELSCAFVVVCGDVFESNQIDRQVLVRALEAMRAVHVPLYLLPGNHDPLDAASIYRSAVFREHAPEQVRVLETDDPIETAPGVWLHPAPWTSKRPLEDLVARALGLGRPTGVGRPTDAGSPAGHPTGHTGLDAGTVNGGGAGGIGGTGAVNEGAGVVVGGAGELNEGNGVVVGGTGELNEGDGVVAGGDGGVKGGAGVVVGGAAAPPGALHVLVGHGIVDALSPDPADPALIRLAGLEAALAAGHLHYVALGDRHSATAVGTTGRIWYSGAPEATDYDETDAGVVLAVTIPGDSGSVHVDRHPTGRWRFRREIVELTTPADLDHLSERLDGLADKERTVLKLGFSGALPLREKARLDDLLDHCRDLFAAVELWARHTDLAVLPDAADFGGLGLVGFAADALEELRTAAARPGDEAVAAQDALALLVRLAGAHRT